jgi:hypothetical protein
VKQLTKEVLHLTTNLADVPLSNCLKSLPF